MYRYLNGEITELLTEQLVLDVSGVGYLLEVSHYTLSAVQIGMKKKLYIVQIIKEDEHVLCGFIEDHERKVFEHLISVSGIGRRVAMAMLSKAPYMRILEWIIAADEKHLTTLPGLGKKTAQRLIVELRDKLLKLYGSSSEIPLDLPRVNSLSSKNNEDVYLALSSLGFKRDEITFMLKGVDLSQLTIEDAIKLALSSNRV